MEKLKLFCTGFVQVVLVTLNTYLVATKNWAAVPVVSFTISFIWTFNVKRAAFGSLSDRIVYSLGAATGGVAGLGLGLLIW